MITFLCGIIINSDVLIGGIIGFSGSFLIFIITEIFTYLKNHFKKKDEEKEKENYLKEILKFLSVNLNTQEQNLLSDKEELSNNSFNIELKSSNFDVKIELLNTISNHDLLKIHKRYSTKLNVFSEFLSSIYTVENVVKKYPLMIDRFNNTQKRIKFEMNSLRDELESYLNNQISSPIDVHFFYLYSDQIKKYEERIKEVSINSDLLSIYYRLVICQLKEQVSLQDLEINKDIRKYLNSFDSINESYTKLINEYQKEFVDYLLIFSNARKEFNKLINSLK